MNEPQIQIYEFGDFRLDADKRLLTKGNNEPLPLTPKVFDTFLYLVRHHGKVIEKDQLMREIWADTIVEENNLSQNISISKFRQFDRSLLRPIFPTLKRTFDDGVKVY